MILLKRRAFMTYKFKTVSGTRQLVLTKCMKAPFKQFGVLGNSHQNSTTGKNLLSNKANDWNIGKGTSWGGLIDSQIDITNSTKNAVIEIPLKSSTTYFFINGKKDVLWVYRIIEKTKMEKGCLITHFIVMNH